jgi:hypothetical protein
MPVYPRTVRECIEDGKTYRRGCLTALRMFRRSKPWQGRLAQRRRKFHVLHLALCQVYRINPALVVAIRRETGHSGESHFTPRTNAFSGQNNLTPLFCMLCIT